MKNGRQRKQFVVCIYKRNDEDVEFGKVYAIIPDPKAEKEGLVRIIDDSGEDYLYPHKYFATIQLSESAKAAFAHKG